MEKYSLTIFQHCEFLTRMKSVWKEKFRDSFFSRNLRINTCLLSVGENFEDALNSIAEVLYHILTTKTRTTTITLLDDANTRNASSKTKCCGS